MPFALGSGGAIYMALAVLGAAFVRGYSGFGFSALVIAASGLVTNPLNLVAPVMIGEAVMSAQQWRTIGRDADWRRVGLLLVGAAVGLPLGLWALTSISENAARAAISAFVLFMSVVLIFGWRMKSRAGTLAHVAAGVASGAANAPGMGGLPVAAFFAAQSLPAATFRATLVAYFPLLDLYSAPLYWLHGLITRDTFTAALVTLPLAIFGNWLGAKHFLRTDPKEFRRFAIGLLAVLATLGLVKSLLSWQF